MSTLKYTLGAALTVASMAVAAQVMTPQTDRTSPNVPVGVNEDRLMTLDTDKDGKISRKEADRDLKRDWSKYDANKDGYIDATELAAIPPSSPRPGG